MGSSFFTITDDSLAPLMIEPALKSRMYFWDLKSAALGSFGSLASNLDEFQTLLETGALFTIEPAFMEEVTWPDMDLVEGSR